MSKHLDEALDLMDVAVRQAAVERLSIALTNVAHDLDDLDFDELGKTQRERLLAAMRLELDVARHTVDAIRLAEGLAP